MNDLRLNLGCGAKHLDGYINVDKESGFNNIPNFGFGRSSNIIQYLI